MKAGRAYTLARERLNELAPLGPFFRDRDVERKFDWDRRTAAQYIWRWKEAGLIRSLGGKSGVYFNLEVEPQWQKNLPLAVMVAMPFAAETGVPILSAAGVTTQIPDERHFIVPSRENFYQVEGAIVEPRPGSWIRLLQDTGAMPTGGLLPKLSVGAAIADLLLFSPANALAPDDIDFGEIEPREARQLRVLLADTGTDPVHVVYRRLYDEVQEHLAQRGPQARSRRRMP